MAILVEYSDESQPKALWGYTKFANRLYLMREMYVSCVAANCPPAFPGLPCVPPPPSALHWLPSGGTPPPHPLPPGHSAWEHASPGPRCPY